MRVIRLFASVHGSRSLPLSRSLARLLPILVASVLWCSPALAGTDPNIGTIVQSPLYGYSLFDPSLGVLLGVKVDASAQSSRQILLPGGPLDPRPVNVTWSVNGVTSVFGVNGGGGPLSVTIPMSGSGSGTVQAGEYGINYTATGSTSFWLDPAPFVSSVHSGFGFDYLMDFDGQPSYSGNIVTNPSVPAFEQRNGNTTFVADQAYVKLTYIYAINGVPEPATWAMMLLGFLGIGAAMRRRRAVALAQ